MFFELKFSICLDFEVRCFWDSGKELPSLKHWGCFAWGISRCYKLFINQYNCRASTMLFTIKTSHRFSSWKRCRGSAVCIQGTPGWDLKWATHGLIDIPPLKDLLPTPCKNTRNFHSKKYRPLACNIKYYMGTFPPSTVNLWNTLPPAATLD